MKLVKMSLAAAMLMGASVYAIDNVKVNGDAKVYYNTNDADVINPLTNETGNSLFSKETSTADTALRLGVTGDLLKGVSFGVTGYAISTLGLENNLVRGTWTGAHSARVGTGATYGEVDDNAWIGELWVAATAGKTTAKLGRMELDTPLAFSEKWSVVPNTFDAAVVLNQDIPDTTLVAAWVGKGNGTNAVGGLGFGTDNTSILDGAGLAIDRGVVGADANFVTFAHGGAYAVGAINNSFKPLVAQAWYYDVAAIADAYWLQADWDCQLLKDVKVGAQYANMDPKGNLAAHKDSSAYAFKLGYEGIQNLKISAAYSEVDKDGTLHVANLGTNNLGNAQSKLYTEAAWGGSNYGYVSAPGAEAWNFKASYDVKDMAKFCASYTTVDNEIVGSTHNVDEVALSVSKSFGPLDAKLSYISTDADDQNDLDGSAARYNTVNVYLTLNF